MDVQSQLGRMKKAVVVQSATGWRYVDDGRTQPILTNFIFFFPYFIQNIEQSQ